MRNPEKEKYMLEEGGGVLWTKLSLENEPVSCWDRED